jgi:hypothetical protein
MRAVVAVLAMMVLAGCVSSRERAADSITDAITPMPGVASAEMEYDAGWRRGDQQFGLTAVLHNDATPAQARAVGEKFTDLVEAADFSAFEVDLAVKYRVIDIMNQVPLTSSARFTVGGTNPPAADGLREWLEIAQSPGVQSVRLNPPEPVGITIDPVATDRDLQALLKAHPDLNSATWTVVGGSPREVSRNAPDYPEVYQVIGMLPDAGLRSLWGQIVAEVGAAGGVSAKTDVAQKDLAAPPTVVDVNFPTSRDREQNLAQAWMVLPLLAKLPLPAKVDFDGAVFVIGGCSSPASRNSSSGTEAELRRKSEKC